MKFSQTLRKSVQPRKQRAYTYKAPLHVKQKLVRSHLSKELRTKYKIRTVSLRTGDTVTVLRGTHKKHSGKVESVNLKTGKVIVSGIEVTKKEGSKTTYPLIPSNLLITQLHLDDARRKKIIQRNTHGEETPKTA